MPERGVVAVPKFFLAKLQLYNGKNNLQDLKGIPPQGHGLGLFTYGHVTVMVDRHCVELQGET